MSELQKANVRIHFEKTFYINVFRRQRQQKLLSRMYKKQKNDLQTFCQVKLKNATKGT